MLYCRDHVIRWESLILLLAILLGPNPAFSETVEQVVAVVNEQILFLSDLHRDTLFFGEGVDLLLQERINRRIHHQLLLNEAKRFVLEPPSGKEIDSEVKAIRRRFKNEREFHDRLTETGMTFPELEEAVANRLLIKTFLEDRIGFFIFVTDEEVDRYQQAHPNDFKGMSTKSRNEQIQAILKAQKEKEKTDEYITQLVSRAKIQINVR